jgi:hypothetical protein
MTTETKRYGRFADYSEAIPMLTTEILLINISPALIF